MDLYRIIQAFKAILTQVVRSIAVDKNKGFHFLWIGCILLLVGYTLAQDVEDPEEVSMRPHLKEGPKQILNSQLCTKLPFQDKN